MPIYSSKILYQKLAQEVQQHAICAASYLFNQKVIEHASITEADYRFKDDWQYLEGRLSASINEKFRDIVPVEKEKSYIDACKDIAQEYADFLFTKLLKSGREINEGCLLKKPIGISSISSQSSAQL